MLKVQSKHISKSLATRVLLSLLLSSCAPSVAAALPTSGSPAVLSPEPVETRTAEIDPAGSAAQSQSASIPPGTPTSIPPADNRPKPEDWREWPVIPIPSARARQIYQQGIAAGTDPTRVSKVGDCQAIQEVLLGRYDKPSGYVLRENQEALAETIQQFAGSFGRDGEAVQGGFNAASELSPLWSNPDTCEPGETPLECEIRVHNPSIVLISLEVWWDGRSPDVYVKNMRQIIDLAISKGILPILSTKADNVEGDHSINLATAKLAYEYDLPLWNWWKAAQALPNHGLDPDRPDGFHISLESWDERSFTALQSIDSVWRGVSVVQVTEATPIALTLTQPTSSGVCSIIITPGSDCASPAGSGDTATPAAAITNASSEFHLMQITDPAIISNPAGFILLSTARHSGETVMPLGVYLIKPDTGAVIQILPEGSSLQAVSPDGRQILFSYGTTLVLAVLDGSQLSIITNQFVDYGKTAAGWQADGKAILFLTEEDGKTLLARYPLDGSTTWNRLSPAGENPIEIFGSVDPTRVYWANGTCAPSGTCTRNGVNVSGLDGSSLEMLPGAQKAAFSSDGHWLVYEGRSTADKSELTLATTDLKTRRELENIGNSFLDFSWSPDGSKLSVLTLDRSDYSGKWGDIRNLVITPKDMGTKILPSAAGINTRAVWSPDGGSLLLTGTLQTPEGYAIQVQVMDVTTGSARDLTGAAGFKASDFIYTNQIFWIKPVN